MTSAPRPITPDEMADFIRLDDIQISPTARSWRFSRVSGAIAASTAATCL